MSPFGEPRTSASIEIDEGKRVFAPGEEVTGSVKWELPDDPRTVELRLGWHTTGKGERDEDTAARERFDGPGRQDWRPFSLRLPDGPYSFSGKLITLTWGLVLAAEPSGELARIELVVSPTGAALRLPSLDVDDESD